MISAEFLTHILDQLRRLDGVAARRMFGGAGLFRNKRMFGLIADDTLYFKVTPWSRADYEGAGMRPFEYAAKGRTKTIGSYWQVPESVIEEPERLARWAEAACAASADRTERPRPSSRRRRRKLIKS